MNTAATTKFHVYVDRIAKDGSPMYGHRATVYAESRETAGTEAIKAAIRNAKAYNAKYHDSFAQHDVEWMLEAETAEAYTVRKVRKAPARKN